MKLLLFLLALSLPVICSSQSSPNSSPNPLLNPTYLGVDGKQYIPLTNAQIDTYLTKITSEQFYSDIRVLDLLEHVQPSIIMPSLSLIILKNGDGVVAYNDSAQITVSVAGILNYSQKLPPVTFSNAAPIDPWWRPVISIGAGVAVAAVVEYLARTLNEASMLIGIGSGALAGGVLYIAIR